MRRRLTHDARRAMPKLYRPNVAAIIQRADGRVLIGQRSDYPESWQFPQGGVDRGESAEEAVRREVREEVGLPEHLYKVTEHRGPYRYDFPTGPDRRGFHGQEQTYFLCVLLGSAAPECDLAGTCGEFAALQWVEVGHFPLDAVPPIKRDVYRAVLRDFFGCGTDSR